MVLSTRSVSELPLGFDQVVNICLSPEYLHIIDTVRLFLIRYSKRGELRMYIQKNQLIIVLRRLIKIGENIGIRIYFFLIFVLLAVIYFPSFFDPPRSDYWAAFYFFHNLNFYPGVYKWLHILNYDPFTQVRFQPFAYLLMYLQHLIFGSNFFYYHVVNFLLYYINIILLYRLAIFFCKSKILIVIYLSIFAFLFSHFDIVSWSYHFYILLGFCLFLLGFILYIKYLDCCRKNVLFFVSILFLSGMLCYESFALWPFGIIILSYIDRIKSKQELKKNKIAASYLSVIGIVYFLYIMFFFFTRIIRTYGNSYLPLDAFFSFRPIVIFATFFNILYNGILVNLLPIIAFPARIAKECGNCGNMELGGFIDKYAIEKVVFIGGGVFIIMFLLMISYLFWKKHFTTLKVVIFLFFLLFSEFFVLLYCKLLTNNIAYSIQQFRYQYIPNALLILIILFLSEGLLKLSQRKKIIVGIILSAVFILNISLTRYYVLYISKELAPLKNMLSDIKFGIKNGKINIENKLYIEDNITQRLPYLSWNEEMGKRFMKGTYQWLFNKKEIKYFSCTTEDAKWVINGLDYRVSSK